MARSVPLIAIVGSLGAATLAFGLAMGGHAVLGSEEPGRFSPVPTSSGSTPGPSPSTSASPIAMSDDFCTLMDETAAYINELEESSAGDDLFMDLSDESKWDDPALLDAVHELGQAQLDSIEPLNGYFLHAAELVEDPEVREAFETFARVYETQMETLGQMAIDATSVAAYMTAIFATLDDPELNSLEGESNAAGAIVNQYVIDTCGRDILGGGSDTGTVADTQDTAVKADVSMLGREIVTYYVGWNEGDPQPVVTVVGGEYVLNGTSVGYQSVGVDLTDQFANGPTDWCVEVTSTSEGGPTYIYTPALGLWKGTCS